MKRTGSGYILIEALIAVAGLLALLAILVSDQHQRMDTVQLGLRQTRAEECADGAVQQALAILSTSNQDLVTLNDTWAQLGGTTGVAAASSTPGNQVSGGTEEFTFPDGTSFREQIIDAGSLINLNTATEAQMTQLPLDQDQVDCFLDWTQTGETARSDGAKDDFYNALPIPYNAKLGPLTTVNELTLIDNWTAQTLYQPPTDTTVLPLPTDSSGNILPLASMFTVDSGAPNVSYTGTALINLSTRPSAAVGLRLITLGVSRQIVARLTSTAVGNPPVTSWAALLSLPGVNSAQEQILLNNVTFSSATRLTGEINLNTASLAVLESIPNVTPTIAQAIVSQQSSTFQGLGGLATVGGISRTLLPTLAGSFVVGSDTWIVRAYGESGGVGSAEEAVVGFRNNQLQIISVNRLHTAGIPSWWGWDTTTTSTQQAGVTQ